jgi:hypothetical protein
MDTSNSTIRFACVLEKHLPPIEEVHLLAHNAGFTAWTVLVDERLKIVDGGRRAEEFRLLLSCCREEFCNFARYSRNLGGDGLILPELQQRRATPSSARVDGTNYLLESDARMRADLSIAKQYAQNVLQRFTTELSIERRRYIEEALRLTKSSSGSSVSQLALIYLQGLFGEAGFASAVCRADSACFTKTLGPSAEVLVCLDNFSQVGQAGWRGELPITSYVWGPSALEAGYQRTCSKHIRGLPLRVHGLVPGAEAYANGGYFLPTSIDATAASEVITLVAREAPPESPEDSALVLAQVALAVDCYLTLLRTAEQSLAAACTEFARDT